MNGVKLDGKFYRVRVVYDTLEENFDIGEGPNAGDMLSWRHERDLLGTKYGHSFSVEPDPAALQDFDDFYSAISAPVNSHMVEMPSGQGVMTYEAMIQSGKRRYKGLLAGRRRWAGLVVNYIPIEPQRLPD